MIDGGWRGPAGQNARVEHGGLGTSMAAGPVVLDGGLATELERRGHDVTGALWSARLLRDDPRAIVDAHAAYLAAGARVLTSASYQGDRRPPRHRHHRALHPPARPARRRPPGL